MTVEVGVEAEAEAEAEATIVGVAAEAGVMTVGIEAGLAVVVRGSEAIQGVKVATEAEAEAPTGTAMTKDDEFKSSRLCFRRDSTTLYTHESEHLRSLHISIINVPPHSAASLQLLPCTVQTLMAIPGK